MKTQPNKAYLFDVDGVLTDPEALRIKQPALIDELIKRLHHGNAVGFNTGLSLKNMEERVLRYIEKKVKDKQLLQNIIVIAEKGGESLTYDEKGNAKKRIDETIHVPQALQDDVKELLTNPQYSEILQLNTTKYTMLTVYIRPKEERKATFEDFLKAQEAFAKETQKLINQHDLQDDFLVDKTTVAIDIESKRVGKGYGARKFVEILEKRGIMPHEYICFGDSPSDYAMYEAFKQLGKQLTFVFVREKKYLEGKDVTDVIFTHQQADKGTLEYLQRE